MKKFKKIGILLGLASICSVAVFAESSKKFKVNEKGAKVPYKVLGKTKDGVEIRISLKNPEGKKLTGLPNPKGMGATGELGYDLENNILGTDEYGIDIEGLTKTPDEKYLVGIMQSTMHNPSKKDIVNKRVTRILKFELATGKT